MNKKVLKTLEFNKIIDLLKDEAGSDMGRRLCENLTPSSDYHEIKIRRCTYTSLAKGEPFLFGTSQHW